MRHNPSICDYLRLGLGVDPWSIHNSQEIIAMAMSTSDGSFRSLCLGAPHSIGRHSDGAADNKTMRNAMFLSTITFLAVYFATRSTLGNSAIWLSFSTFLVARGVYILTLTSGLKSIFVKIDNK